MKYFTFPMETLNVTQNYSGKTSHYPHTTGDPKDYPIDIAGVDGGQSAVFARVPLKVVAKRGIGSSATNTVWLESIDKVMTPTFVDIAWMTLTHWNDGDTAMKKWPVGAVIPAGEIICFEGVDGATANHLHLTCGRGHCNNWTQNSAGKWVMTGESLPPEQIFYLDRSFTTIIKNEGSLLWNNLPIVNNDKNEIETLNNKINDLNNQLKAAYKRINDFEVALTDSNNKISELEKNQEKHDLKSFRAELDAYYYINLNKNETIYYEIRKD